MSVFVSGKLRDDPRAGQLDNGVPVVEALMSCPAYWGTVYVWIRAVGATYRETVLNLRKDDVLTVRGDVLRFGIGGDGDPYAEVLIDTICALRHMPDVGFTHIKRLEH